MLPQSIPDPEPVNESVNMIAPAAVLGQLTYVIQERSVEDESIPTKSK
jgi:hypothetical protein